MGDLTTLSQAIASRGPYAVWDLMEDEERRAAAAALWTHAERETRVALELALAKELKFRPQSVRHLGVERVGPRLTRLAASLPDAVLFQFLFHLHLADRRPLLVEFLDAVNLPHDNGVLELKEDTAPPQAEPLAAAGRALLERHGRPALVYLATLLVADKELWAGLTEVLAGFDEKGSPLG